MPSETPNLLEQHVQAILENARFAPSVHNAQPWQADLEGDSLQLSIAQDQRVQDGDPTGRENIISLGIFSEAVCMAAKAVGLVPGNVVFKDQQASIHFTQGTADEQAMLQVQHLRSRATDRSIYRQTDIGDALTASIEREGKSAGIETVLVTDRAIVSSIADLTSKGIGLALSNPAFRKELRHYLVLPWSSKKRGIAVSSLYLPWPLGLVQPFLLRFSLKAGKEAALEKQRWLSASGIVVILGDGDTSQYWFDAGRAYLRVSVAIEAAGLSQATSAAIVEASNYHEDIEGLLGTQKRILGLIRIGQGSPRRKYSPRVSVSEILT